MLRAGDLVPHFHVRTLDGAPVAYASLWQRRNLILVLLPESGEAEYVAKLQAHMGELTSHETACVITRDRVEGLPSPGVAIADRWGELSFVTEGLPPPGELVEWLQYTQMQCPECQGEVK